MKPYNSIYISLFVIVLLLLQVSCQKSDGPDDQPDPNDSLQHIISHTDSRLVTDLNGYRFDGAFSTGEAQAYPYLWVQYVDDYNDSTRILVLNQNEFQTITKYQVSNLYNGFISRKFDHGSFPNNASNCMSFNFNHDMFLLNSFDPASGTISETGTVFGMNTQVSQIYTGILDQYRYQFLHRYLIRYISGISLWPFNYPNWNDQPQFIATSELSDPKAIGHYFDESWQAWPYDVQNNMYSGFLQSTLAATYVGIAKGTVNLDTFYLNNNPPNLYDPQVCRAFVDRSGNTLYLGILINVPNTPDLKASSFILDLMTNELAAVYEDRDYPYTNSYFKSGSFYGRPNQGGQYVKINELGIEESISLPVSAHSANLMFSRNKIFAIVSESGGDSRIEIYSRAL
jgi:hypothetical protein